jgi:hypothetical protein
MPTYVVMVKKRTIEDGEDAKKIKKNKCRKIKLMQPSPWDAELEARKQLKSDEDIMDISMFQGDLEPPHMGARRLKKAVY